MQSIDVKSDDFSPKKLSDMRQNIAKAEVTEEEKRLVLELNGLDKQRKEFVQFKASITVKDQDIQSLPAKSDSDLENLLSETKPIKQGMPSDLKDAIDTRWSSRQQLVQDEKRIRTKFDESLRGEVSLIKKRAQSQSPIARAEAIERDLAKLTLDPEMPERASRWNDIIGSELRNIRLEQAELIPTQNFTSENLAAEQTRIEGLLQRLTADTSLNKAETSTVTGLKKCLEQINSIQKYNTETETFNQRVANLPRVDPPTLKTLDAYETARKKLLTSSSLPDQPGYIKSACVAPKTPPDRSTELQTALANVVTDLTEKLEDRRTSSKNQVRMRRLQHCRPIKIMRLVK